MPHFGAGLDRGRGRAIHRLQVQPLGARRAGAAEVEDRQAQLDLPAALARLARLAVAEHAELEQARVASDLGEPERARSEEHTSELQSLMRISYAVLCLKKK